MKKILLLLTLILHVGLLFAANDTLWVEDINQKPHVRHTIEKNQSIFTLSKMYNVNVSVIANANNKTYQKGFANGDIVYIPLTIDNYASEAGANLKPIYYRTKDNETLLIISKWLNVRQSMIQTWNQLPTPHVQNGQILVIGWVKQQNVSHYNRQRFNPNNLPDEAIGQQNEQLKTPLFQQQYEQKEDTLETEERGALTFYKNKSKLKDDVYYAFHNTIPNGSIVKIVNPSNNKAVYAKVISKLPQIEEYHNSIIALSDNAYQALDAMDGRIFCNLFYKL